MHIQLIESTTYTHLIVAVVARLLLETVSTFFSPLGLRSSLVGSSSSMQQASSVPATPTLARERCVARPPARPPALNRWGPSYAYWVTMAGLNVVLMLPCAPA